MHAFPFLHLQLINEAVSLRGPRKNILQKCDTEYLHYTHSVRLKQDYKLSAGSIPTRCDILYLVFVAQLAGCQLIYPPSLTSAEEEMEQIA